MIFLPLPFQPVYRHVPPQPAKCCLVTEGSNGYFLVNIVFCDMYFLVTMPKGVLVLAGNVCMEITLPGILKM